jgi:hypothetical protein
MGKGPVVVERHHQEIDRFQLRQVVSAVVVFHETVAVAEELRIADVMHAELIAGQFRMSQQTVFLDPIAVVARLAGGRVVLSQIHLRQLGAFQRGGLLLDNLRQRIGLSCRRADRRAARQRVQRSR